MKKWLIVLGVALSAGILAWVVGRMNWSAFFTSLGQLQWPFVAASAVGVMFSVALRSLRWTWIAARPITDFYHFWRAFNVGYLGNIIYPARAGEVIRMVVLGHFTEMPFAAAAASAVLDRFFDLLAAGVLMTVVIAIHGQNVLGPSLPWFIASLLGAGVLGLVLLVLLENRLRAWAMALTPRHVILTWLRQTFVHGLDILGQLKQSHAAIRILLASLAAAACDGVVTWSLLHGFGWDLGITAGFTVLIFLMLGTSLPSAPGYIGLYQLACILALALYGIAESEAVAYSLVLQLLTFGVIMLQGGWVALHYGLRLRKIQNQATHA